MRVTHLTLALVIGTAGALAAQDTTAQARPAAVPALTVEAILTRGVVDRVPQDTATAFPPDVGQLVLWTKVSGGSPGQTIHHVWFHGDNQVADIELPVNGSPWRTWSRKTVPAEWTGAWHVEVRDAAGTVLKRIDFTAGQ